MAAMFTPGALGALQGQQPDTTEDDTVDPTTLQSVMSQMAVLRDKELANRQKSWDMVAQRLEKSRPSKAEMWFSLASALAQPTKTGSFGETLGNTAEALGKSAAERREYETKVADTMLQREQDLAELGSKYDLKGIELGIAANKAGTPKFVPVGDNGYLKIVPGQNPEYVPVSGIPSKTGEWVETVDSAGVRGWRNTKSNEFKAAERSPEEEAIRSSAINVATRDSKNISDAKARVPLLDNSEKALNRAIGLVDKSFTGPLAGVEKNISRFINPENPKLAATAQLDTIAGQQVVQVLKATFSGSTSNAELEYLDGLYGKILNGTASERKAALTEARDYVASRKLQDRQLLSSLAPPPAKSGRTVAPTAPPEKGAAPTTPAAKNLPPLTTFYKK